MAFDYGSIDLGIRNPFKIVGIVDAVAGAVIALVGIGSLLSVKGIIASGAREEGTITAIVGLILTAWGLTKIGFGLKGVFRFFVGRSVPVSLAKISGNNKAANGEDKEAYKVQQLQEMLHGRKNISFKQPHDWLMRMLLTVFPSLLCLPNAYRNMAQQLVQAVTYTSVALLCWALALFSGMTGILNITGTPVMDWLMVLLSAILIPWWFHAGFPLPRLLKKGRETPASGAVSLTVAIAVAIFLPPAMVYFHKSVAEFPAITSSGGGHILAVLGLGVASVSLLGMLLRARSRMANPVVEVAEYRDNWQESIHPQEILIHFEQIVMANRRYKEVPNRVYASFDPKLFEQGSKDKGAFGGVAIQETQPVFLAHDPDERYTKLRLASYVVGAVLLVAAAFMSFFWPGIYAGVITGSATVAAAISITGYTAIVWLFGRLLKNLTLLFWAEMQFESLLVSFECQGTYTESKLATGTSIYDSTRSENTMVRASMTACFLATRAVSSTYAAIGSMSSKSQRHILEMHKAERHLESIVEEIKHFVGDRESIASINSEKDLGAAARIFQVNQQVKALQLEADQTPFLDRGHITQSTAEGTDEPRPVSGERVQVDSQ